MRNCGPFWRCLGAIALSVFSLVGPPAIAAAPPDKLRVIIETDLGGDADDQASLVRFLMYSNEWDVDGIIADRPAEAMNIDGARNHLGRKFHDGLDMARVYLDAYGEVRDNLATHRPDYPTLDYLRTRTVPGWNSTDEGVKLLISAGDRDDPRPIWYGNWGSNSGSTSNLRRALDKVQAERSPEDYRKFASRFRIVSLDGNTHWPRQGHADDILLHVEVGFPAVDKTRWYHRFRPITEKAGGFNIDRDVRKNHGPLGALYTTQKEGDSWSFIYLIPTGLSDPLQPTWGSWAGRYGLRDDEHKGPNRYWCNTKDTWTDPKSGKVSTNRDNTARRWAVHLQNDFKARMDWCVAKFEDANHPPEPRFQGDASLKPRLAEVKAGASYPLDASGTLDPDGNKLSFSWYVYPESGTYLGGVTIRDPSSPRATVDVPGDASGKSIHVVLEVTDDGTPALTRYRRAVINVR
jgi:Protein of unknown function (DUF1593)